MRDKLKQELEAGDFIIVCNKINTIGIYLGETEMKVKYLITTSLNYWGLINEYRRQHKIGQVLTNIIGNSISYGNEKGETVVIEVEYNELIWLERKLNTDADNLIKISHQQMVHALGNFTFPNQAFEIQRLEELRNEIISH